MAVEATARIVGIALVAAGALLLGDRARDDLVNSLCLGARTANCGPRP
jgi:hypothetical protein